MEDLDFSQIGAKIHARRRAQGLTQEDIAQKLDVNASHISNIERGRAHPSLSSLIGIANALDCSADYFIDHEYTRKKPSSVDKKLHTLLLSFDNEEKERAYKILELLKT